VANNPVTTQQQKSVAERIRLRRGRAAGRGNLGLLRSRILWQQPTL